MVKHCRFIGLTLMLMLGIMLSGIEKPTEAAAATERPKNIKVNIVGFVAPTGMHLRAELIAEALRKEYPDWAVKAFATPKAVGDVLRHRQEKSAQFFMSLQPWRLERQSFGPAFRKRGIDFAKVFQWNPVIPTDKASVHFFVLNKTGLTSARDIVTKRYPLKAGYSAPGGHVTLSTQSLNTMG